MVPVFDQYLVRVYASLRQNSCKIKSWVQGLVYILTSHAPTTCSLQTALGLQQEEYNMSDISPQQSSSQQDLELAE